MKDAKLNAGSRILVVKNDKQMASCAADVVCELLQAKPNAVLGLPTGSTPVGMYEELVKRYQAKEVDFASASSFNLDEYVGLPVDHPCSYHFFMQEHLFSGVNLKPERRHLPEGSTSNPEQAAAEYDSLLTRLGPIDLMILGIGRNGHIGFNEPGTPFETRVHVTPLTESTITANARFFDSVDQVPQQAVTMGIANIMESRRVMLLAKGESKAPAIKAMLEGEVTWEMPASVLQGHASLLLLLDEAAASLLTSVHFESVSEVNQAAG